MACLGLVTQALQAQTLVIDQVLHWEDPQHRLTPAEALQSMQAKPRAFQGIDAPYSDSSHWFLLDIRSLDNVAPTDILHIKNTLISEFQAWLVVGSELQALPAQTIRHRYPLLQLQTKPNERLQILLKIFLPDITGLKFEALPPTFSAYEGPFNAFSFGFMLAGFAAGLLIYNLILFLFLRDLDLANFSLYAFCLIVASFGATGGFTVLGLPAWTNRWVACIAAISMASGLRFTRSFFDTCRMSPTFDRLFLAGQISNVLCCVLLAANVSRKFQYLIDANMVLCLMLCLSFAFVAWRKGHDLARNYLLGWSGYVLALIIMIGLQYGWIQRSMLTENAGLFALDFQILVLSSAIGSKITRMRADLMRQLKEANNALEKKVEERTRTVMEQQQTMIQTAKMASLGEMAGGIAHEINNPLMIISGYAENMATLIQKDQLTQDKAIAFHERIQKATDRIRKIVNGLRNLSRDTTHDEFTETTLEAVIHDALSLCESRFAHNGVALRVVLPAEPVHLRCNAGQICQILINLLNNAYDATETMNKAWVEIHAEDQGDLIRIRIMDCGPGIPPAVAERIFDPFFTTKEIGKGTGLGLSISKSLMERHGGHIYVDQSLPHTCFVLELRKDQAPHQTAA